MKNIKYYALGILVIALLGLFFARCSSNYNNNNDGLTQTSGIKVRLFDGPGDYQEVNIDVRDVMIKATLNADDSYGWVSIGNIPAGGQIVDLLKLTGGVNALLVDKKITSGYLGQIRLVLGDRNTIKLNGATTAIPLNTPSAQQSGLKLQVNQTLLVDKTYEFLLDFDVEHSVVKAGGSGNYNLHPVIRVTTAEASGGITGKVIAPVVTSSPLTFPAGFAVGVTAVKAGNDPITTTMNVSTGVFQLSGLPSGTYTVTLTPSAPPIPPVTTPPTPVAWSATPIIITGVAVTNGVITDIHDFSF